MNYCTNHPSQKSYGTCRYCVEYFCKDCLLIGQEYNCCSKVECMKSNEAKLLPKEISCPKCNTEFELILKERMSDRVHCPECEVRIDYSVTPPLVEEPKNYVEIAWSLNQADISLIKSILDDTEIDYYVFGENFLSVDPLIQPARIFVLDEQTVLVKDILKDFKVHIVGVSMRDDMTDED